MSTKEASVKDGLESMQIQWKVSWISDKTKKREHRCEKRVFPQASIVAVLGKKEELVRNAEAMQTQMH